MKELVSIIIPCFNDAQYIEQAVESALNQTYSNIEVLVVDDGSNDETKQVLKLIEPKISKLISQTNKGQSTARNEGIKLAKGIFILVLDSDDFIENSLCEKAVNFLEEENTKIVTCYANLLFENGTSNIFRPAGGDITKFLISNEAMGTSFFRKRDWNEVGGYDESMKSGFEDWEFFIRLLAKGGSTFVINEPLYNYRKRYDSTSIKANKIKYDLLKYIYLKHEDLYKQYYKVFVSHLIKRIEREEKEKIKNLNRIEFKLVKFILKPFRFIKSLMK